MLFGAPLALQGGMSSDCAPGEPESTGVGNINWYRFEGAGGDALPLTPPGNQHCGAQYAGWLTGCSDGWSESGTCSTPGHYPSAAEGMVEMTACFSQGSRCDRYRPVGVVRCGDFLLWRLTSDWLTYAPSCNLGYCTAPSGL